MGKQKPNNKKIALIESLGLKNVYGANPEFIDSAFTNNITFLDYYLQFQNNIMSMFEWKGLPKTIDPRYLELQLFFTGHVIFFENEIVDKDGKPRFNNDGTTKSVLLCLGGALFEPNIYGNMLKRQPIAMNGEVFPIKDNTNSVIIYNNYTRTASAVTTQNYAKGLYNIKRTIDVNLNTMKTPIIIRTNPKNELALKNAMMKYDGNQPVIYVDDGQSVEDVLKVLDMGINPHIQELNDYFKEFFAQGLTNQGIPVSGSQKMERLLNQEVTVNNAQNLLIADGKHKCRQEAVRFINDKWGKKFNFTASVDYSNTYKEFLKSSESESVGEPNELYNDDRTDTRKQID